MWNHKRLYRIYTLRRLNLRNKIAARVKAPLFKAHWSQHHLVHGFYARHADQQQDNQDIKYHRSLSSLFDSNIPLNIAINNELQAFFKY
ncbi:hypothetical protein SAMN06265350_106201 [Solitalea koreensis]|uniref:Uncharacterized protein n=1 Tax=Solitalea koreensis TaxID=543615 RepID=A0A521DD47_9SPHI|nr:hypothetical protein SAMN06265350_106201 [Solitalea koreensis]